MKILVTGATGFIGNYVVLKLLDMGHQVVATSYDSSKIHTKTWNDKVSYVKHNIYDLSSENLYEKFNRPDKLIHLAWGNLINFKCESHLTTELPTHILFLNNLINNGLKDITCIGTCLEYGMKEGQLLESFETQPLIAYPKAKNILRIYLQKLSETLNIKFRWMRIFYLYGIGQSSKSILSQLQKAIEDDQEYFNMSKGDQIRDYLPVEIAAEYIVKYANQDRILGVVNCSSNNPITILDLVKSHIEKVGANINLKTDYFPYPDYEPKAFWGSNEKLKTIIK